MAEVCEAGEAVMEIMRWTEEYVAGILVRRLFSSRCLVVVNNTTWSGSEADLLGVCQRTLKPIEIEIKVSRSDLRADAGKDKWVERVGWHDAVPPMIRQWPRLIWKHYYCVPASVWHDDLAASLASQKSGVLTIDDRGRIDVRRRVTANPSAKPVSMTGICDIARLASLRMWDAIGVPRA